MGKIAFQLRTQNEPLLNALKRGEEVEVLHHSRVVGVVSPKNQTPLTREEREKAMEGFFGTREYLPPEVVMAEARALRQGRSRQYDDL